jgi:hypothetical protein
MIGFRVEALRNLLLIFLLPHYWYYLSVLARGAVEIATISGLQPGYRGHSAQPKLTQLFEAVMISTTVQFMICQTWPTVDDSKSIFNVDGSPCEHLQYNFCVPDDLEWTLQIGISLKTFANSTPVNRSIVRAPDRGTAGPAGRPKATEDDPQNVFVLPASQAEVIPPRRRADGPMRFGLLHRVMPTRPGYECPFSRFPLGRKTLCLLMTVMVLSGTLPLPHNFEAFHRINVPALAEKLWALHGFRVAGSQQLVTLIAYND